MPDLAPPPRPGAAGGVLIALGMLVGVAVGFAIGEATPGFLVGAGGGIVAAVLVWMRDRRR